MKLKIPYNGVEEEIDFPDDTVVLEGKTLATISDVAIREKIIQGFEAYRDFVSHKKTLLVVNDATRRLPTSKILKILAELIPHSALRIIIATGAHRPPTSAEIDIILGDMKGPLAGKVDIHDCRDEKLLAHIGTTSRGTPVQINRTILDAEQVICINSVEPHFFAGYTGGRKSLIPGLAGFDTIVANHSLAKYEDARSLNLESNPLHLDLEEAISFINMNNIFSIQLVTSPNGEIVDLYCGRMGDSFEKACMIAEEIYTINIERKYDIVFAIGEAPLDCNLYQLQKAQEHGAEAVNDGGILIVVGACREGTGSDFFMNLAVEYPQPELALSTKAMSDNRFGIHKLVKTARRLRRIKIWYVTKLDDKTVRKVYFEPKSSMQFALTEALKLIGRGAKIAILRDACFMVPMMR